MIDPLSQLKCSPFPGAPNVEELENSLGERCLSPTKKWSNEVCNTPLGATVGAFYSLLVLLGIPSQVILTIAAVKFADDGKKIDFEDWIRNRSNWREEDKEGALLVLKGPLPPLENFDGSLNPIKISEEKNSSKDDWNLN